MKRLLHEDVWEPFCLVMEGIRQIVCRYAEESWAIHAKNPDRYTPKVLTGVPENLGTCLAFVPVCISMRARSVPFTYFGLYLIRTGVFTGWEGRARGGANHRE